jgi:hypothetical protein
MEQYSRFSRNELESSGKSLKKAWEEHKEALLYESKHYRNKKHELYTPYYIDKNITEYTEAFAHLCDIEITKYNAFLLHPDRLEKQSNDRKPKVGKSPCEIEARKQRLRERGITEPSKLGYAMRELIAPLFRGAVSLMYPRTRNNHKHKQSRISPVRSKDRR